MPSSGWWTRGRAEPEPERREGGRRWKTKDDAYRLVSPECFGKLPRWWLSVRALGLGGGRGDVAELPRVISVGAMSRRERRIHAGAT